MHREIQVQNHNGHNDHNAKPNLTQRRKDAKENRSLSCGSSAGHSFFRRVSSCTRTSLTVLLFLLSFAPLLLFSSSASAQGAPLFQNGGFEGGSADGRGAGVPGWTPYESGYLPDRLNFHNGEQAIRCDSANLNSKRGAMTTVTLNQKQATPVLVSGWSKADAVSGTANADYSIYVDVMYTDGSHLYGQSAAFGAGTHGWEKRRVLIMPTKPIASLNVFALFRHHTGSVWFDDFGAQVLAGSSVFDGQFLPNRPQRDASVKTVLRAVGGDGLSIGVSPKGTISEVLSGTAAITSAGAGGFWVRDVGTQGEPIAVTGNAVRNGKNGVRVSGAKNGLQLSARIVPDGGSLLLDGEVKSVGQQDRAVTVYFVLPVDFEGGRWGQDIRTTEPLNKTGREHTHQTQVSVGANGGLSLYPFGVLTKNLASVGISSQMDMPSVYRIFYNARSRQFVIAWDFALTTKTLSWSPRNARFRCHLFRLRPQDTAWGFRAAAQRYYQLNKAAYVRHAQAEGIWMPFTAPQTVKNAEDFGFAYHEGDNSVKEDEAHGILSFRYSEPMTFWMPMPLEIPRLYENAVKELERLAASDPQTEKNANMAKAALNSATKDAAGRYNLEFRNEPWGNGAVFILNPNPEMTATKDKPTKASLTYNFEMAKILYPATPDPQRGSLDGEYLDSLESWGEVCDYREQNLASIPYPATFDTNTSATVVPQWFHTHTFARFLSNDLHNRGKLLMANATPIRYAIFAPLCDVMGIEVNWLNAEGNYAPDSDTTMNLRRTLSGTKPYHLLLNTNFDRMTPALMEKYMARALFYGMFPSAFSANASANPYWENPRWYERDRNLFRRYVPLVKKVSAAGWQPVTHATSANSGVWVERFGQRLFTLFNPGQTAQKTSLRFALPELGLPPQKPYMIRNLMDGTEQELSARAEWTIEPEQTVVLEILLP
jgi:hypothetical protein